MRLNFPRHTLTRSFHIGDAFLSVYVNGLNGNYIMHLHYYINKKLTINRRIEVPNQFEQCQKKLNAVGLAHIKAEIKKDNIVSKKLKENAFNRFMKRELS